MDAPPTDPTETPSSLDLEDTSSSSSLHEELSLRLLCDVCEEGEEDEAVIRCRNCDKVFCLSCDRFHSKFEKHHTTYRLGDPEPPFRPLPVFMCEVCVKQGKEAVSHCFHCDRYQCSDCDLLHSKWRESKTHRVTRVEKLLPGATTTENSLGATTAGKPSVIPQLPSSPSITCSFCHEQSLPQLYHTRCIECKQDFCVSCSPLHRELGKEHQLETVLLAAKRALPVIFTALVFRDMSYRPYVHRKSPHHTTILSFDGILYLLEVNAMSIKVFNSDAHVRMDIDLSSCCRAEEGRTASFPCDIAFNSQGLLFVSFLRRSDVLVLSTNGTRQGSFDTKREGDREYGISSICCDDKDNIYVSDEKRCSVRVFDKDYNFMREIHVSHIPMREGKTVSYVPVPEPITRVRIDRKGNIVTCSRNNITVYKDDQLLARHMGPGGSSVYNSVSFDEENRYYVTEREHNYIHVSIGDPKYLLLARFCHNEKRISASLFHGGLFYLVQSEGKVVATEAANMYL